MCYGIDWRIDVLSSRSVSTFLRQSQVCGARCSIVCESTGAAETKEAVWDAERLGHWLIRSSMNALRLSTITTFRARPSAAVARPGRGGTSVDLPPRRRTAAARASSSQRAVHSSSARAPFSWNNTRFGVSRSRTCRCVTKTLIGWQFHPLRGWLMTHLSASVTRNYCGGRRYFGTLRSLVSASLRVINLNMTLTSPPYDGGSIQGWGRDKKYFVQILATEIMILILAFFMDHITNDGRTAMGNLQDTCSSQV